MNPESPDAHHAELVRTFRVADLADAPEQMIEVTASAEERAALAKRYGIVSLDALTAQLTVKRDVSGEIVVDGHLQADVVQKCVVTLEPVAETIACPFDQRFTLTPEEPVADLVIRPDDNEPPEPVTGDSIDLGELVAEFLSLAINPYPRAPDADAQVSTYQTNAPAEGPFAVLAKLREQDQN